MKKLFLVVSALLAISTALFAVNVTGCLEITSPGTYDLIANLSGANISAAPFSGLSCIKVGASALLDCHGHSIRNNGTGGSTAAIMVNESGAGSAIQNCPDLSSYSYGVLVMNTFGLGNTLVWNTTASNNSGDGFLFLNTSSNSVMRATAFNNDAAFTFVTTQTNVLINVSAHDNFDNVLTFSATESNILNNVNATNNDGSAFILVSSNASLFNILVNTNATNNNGAAFEFVNGGGTQLINTTAVNNNDSALIFVNGNSSLPIVLQNTRATNNNGDVLEFVNIGSVTAVSSVASGNNGAAFIISGANASSSNVFFNSNATNNNGDVFQFVTLGSITLQTSLASNNNGSAYTVVSSNASITNTLVNNNALNNNGSVFQMVSTGANTLSTNTATGNDGDAFIIVSSNPALNNVLVNSVADGNNGDAFQLVSTGTNVLASINATNNNGSVFQIVSSNASATNTIANGIARDNNGAAFQLVSTGGNQLSNNIADNNNGSVFQITSSNSSMSNQFINSNATNNNGGAFLLVSTGSNTLVNGRALNNNGSVFQIVSSNISVANTIVSSLASNNDGDAFQMVSTGSNTVVNSNATNNNGNAFQIVSANDTLTNVLNLVMATDNNGSVFQFVSTGGNVVSGCTADNNNGLAISIVGSSVNLSNTVVNCNVTNNNGTAFQFVGTGSNVVANGLAANNTGSAFYFSGTGSNLLDTVVAHDNADAFTFISSGPANTISDFTSFNHLLAGMMVVSSNASLSNGHFYNNGPDFLVSSADTLLSMSDVVFDNPSGGFVSFTNISLSDTVNSTFSMAWAAQPAPLPAGFLSFNNKFLNISQIGGTESLDQITMQWRQGEVGTFIEANFQLWMHNSSGNWTLLNSTPDVTGNTLALAGVSTLGEFAILHNGSQFSSGGGDGGGGGGGGNPDLSIAFNSSGNLITVTSGGDPVPGATVRVNGSIIGTTDSDGQITFSGCGGTALLSATKAGYHAAELDASLAACGGCVTNNDCPATLQCVLGTCGPVACACGTVSNHQCVAFQCCSDAECSGGAVCQDHSCVQPQFECSSDSDCAATEYCDILSGASGGSCKDVQAGACGGVVNHKFVPYGYECGSEPGCPSCPSGSTCTNHECVQSAQGDVSCPASGVVGDTTTCKATVGGAPCAACDYSVTDPGGKTTTGKTGSDGSFPLPLTAEGTYKVKVLKDGQAVESVEVKALPKSGEPGKPTGTGGGEFPWLIVLVLLIVVIIGVVYWRSRKK